MPKAKTDSKIEEKKVNFSLEDLIKPNTNVQNNQTEQYKILLDLMDADKNLELKTEINKPFSFAVLSSYADFMDSCDFKEVANIIRNFAKNYYKLSISKKRMGRKEIIEALKSLGMQQNLGLPLLPQQQLPQQVR